MTLTVDERKKIRVFLCYCALAVFMFYVLFPLYWMLLTSLKTNEEISGAWKFPFWFERGATLFHYEELLFADWSNFTDFYVNTIWITVLVVAESLVISVLAAYSLSRMRFFGSEFLGTGVFCNLE